MLNQQRTELEKLGYAIISQTENEIIGIRRKWFWDCFATNLTMVIFVQTIDSLTAARIDEDATRMIAQARDVDPSSLPLGFQKGRAIISVYLAGRVESDAQRLCTSPQKLRYATMFFPAAIDQSNSSVHYLRSSPFWGSLYFGKLRYPVQRLLESANAPNKEPASIAGIVYAFIIVLSFLCVFFVCLGSIIFLLLAQNWH
jgi:hypothetical protein